MKRIFLSLVLVFGLCSSVYAAGQATAGPSNLADVNPFGKTWTLTADDTLATFDTITVGKVEGSGFITSIVVEEGATAPTDGYVITLYNAQGIAVMTSGGLTGDDVISPATAASSKYTGPIDVAGGYSITVTGNAVPSAVLGISVNGIFK